jgi:hypothetical protein
MNYIMMHGSTNIKSGILLEGRRGSAKYQRENIKFPGQYPKPGVKFIKRDAWRIRLVKALVSKNVKTHRNI